VVTGALTNLAIILQAFPDISTHIRGITLMGGAIGLGNWSPAAEFNILVDPEAASIVFQSGLPITMVPLEVTHTVEVTEAIFADFGKLASSFGQKLTPLFRYFQLKYKEDQEFEFPVAHDPCTIHYLLQPQDFKTRPAYVEVEREGSSRGRTNCHFRHHTPNAIVCQNINVPNFWMAMLECLRKIK
jgi:inosine-uridine nucleoside N-ribohydrolase